MSVHDLLLKQLDYSSKTEDWYPPLKAALEGLSEEQANFRPTGEAANTIWEIASHILFYKERLLVWLKGEWFISDIKSNDDTFTAFVREETWQSFIKRVEQNSEELERIVNSLSEEDLKKEHKGKNYAQMISSINLHDAYHTGQIIQIRKLQGSWPDKRSFGVGN